MGEPESDDDIADRPGEETASGVTRENAMKLTACVEELSNQIERLDDPAVFRVTLDYFKPVE